MLLVIDQFEELFRYRQRTQVDAAEGFIDKLLNAAGASNTRTTSADGRPNETSVEDAFPKIGVVITMRSEYLGDCARYDGLAEAVNAGLYLTPRLDREQLEDAIRTPAIKANRQIDPNVITTNGREIDSKLVTKLRNDVANDQDQLPVLQHALMRCWDASDGKIDLTLYRSIGATDALHQHAESVLQEFVTAAPTEDAGRRREQVTKRLFKRITKPGSSEGLRESEKDGVRDPATLETICLQTKCTAEEGREVVEAFRAAGRAFLRPSPVALRPESIIDITHESLIRKWKTLQTWVRDEAESADGTGGF